MTSQMQATAQLRIQRLFYVSIFALILFGVPLALPVFAQGPATETTIITATNGATGDYFGGRVDVDNGTAVIGAMLADTNSGKLYIYERNQDGAEGWGAVLTLTTGITNGYLGYDLDLENDTLVAGAPGVSPDDGTVYIYERNAGGIADSWGHAITLTIVGSGSGDAFGASVALSGDTLVVGAPNSNKAYVFNRNWGGVDSWGQVATLTVSTTAVITPQLFGFSVAIEDDTIVVGAPEADISGNNNQGAAYIFNRNEGGTDNWGLTTTLTDTLGHANDRFGQDVAIDHDKIVVGIPYVDIGINTNVGMVKLYDRNGGGIADSWLNTKTRQGYTRDGNFGYSVALRGDTMVVGAIDVNSNRGASYIFRRNRGGVNAWGLDATLTASDAAADDHFGNAVALDVDSNTFVIGAAGWNSNQGKAYIFNSSGNFWKEMASPVAEDGAGNDQFGNAVAISGDTLLAGAQYAEVNTTKDDGEAYIFERNQGGKDNWGQVVTLTRISSFHNEDYFGSAVALDNDTAIVGAKEARVGTNLHQGSAVIFERNEGGADNWGAVVELTAPNGVNYDDFGEAVAISGDTALVGASSVDIDSNTGQGAAYIFYRNEGGTDNWGQVITLTEGAAGDHFGEALALDGDIAVVGVQHADPNGSTEQGAAYIFYRNQGGADNWGRVITLTEGVAGDRDHFGYSVDIDGNIAVVSAPDAKPDGSIDTGAAYVFERNQGGADNWGLIATLAPTSLEEDDWVNAQVSVSGDTIVVSSAYAGSTGKAYVFDRNQGGADNWGLSGVWESADPTALRFGASAAIDANTIVIGDTYADVDGNNSQGSAYVYQLALAPDLGISKSVTPDTANPGDAITYTLSYSNHGTIPAFGVVITDEIPISVTNFAYSSSGAIVTPTGAISYVWNVVDLPVGVGGIITITGILSDDLPAQTFANTAQIDATNVGWLSDNTASAELIVGDIGVRGLTAENDSPALTGTTINFTATITNGYEVSYLWNFGDEHTSTDRITTHHYSSSGPYTAIVTATSQINVMTATTTVTVTDEAISGLSVTGDSPVELGTDPNLLASISTGSNVQYDWDFGNGEFCGGCGDQPLNGIEYEYTTNGTYTVVVTAYNALNSLTDSLIIEVTPAYNTFIYLPLVLK